MYIADVNATMKLARNTEEVDNTGLHYLFAWRRDSSNFYLENWDAVPTEENWQEAAQHMTEISEVDIDATTARKILALYPQTRIKMAVYNSIADTDIREGLSFALAHFFVGCAWPTYGDKIDIEQFISLLKKQAQLMGFKIVTMTGNTSAA